MYEQCPDISRQVPTPFLHRTARPYLFGSLAREYGFQEIGSRLFLRGRAVLSLSLPERPTCRRFRVANRYGSDRLF